MDPIAAPAPGTSKAAAVKRALGGTGGDHADEKAGAGDAQAPTSKDTSPATLTSSAPPQKNPILVLVALILAFVVLTRKKKGGS